MFDPRHPLTLEVQEKICRLVRDGGFPHVAAVAVGIPLKTFLYWMRCGQARRPVKIYRDFCEAVQQAQAEARLIAEAFLQQRRRKRTHNETATKPPPTRNADVVSGPVAEPIIQPLSLGTWSVDVALTPGDNALAD